MTNTEISELKESVISEVNEAWDEESQEALVAWGQISMSLVRDPNPQKGFSDGEFAWDWSDDEFEGTDDEKEIVMEEIKRLAQKLLIENEDEELRDAVGMLFGEPVSREQVEEWAEAFWDETWGNIRKIWSGERHYLTVFENGSFEIGADVGGGFWDKTHAVLLNEPLELSEDINLKDDEDVRAWEECYENDKVADIERLSEEIISSLDCIRG